MAIDTQEKKLQRFVAAFQKTVGVEGDFSNNPADRGGQTRFGITEAVARANGYKGKMSALPFSKARDIYKKQYWALLSLDDVSALSQSIAEELFDTGVNAGTGVAGEFLQRSLNALNRNKSDYQDVKVDNAVGPLTVAALRAYLTKRGKTGENVLLGALNSLQGAFYISLAEADATQETFVFGWLKNRVLLEVGI